MLRRLRIKLRPKPAMTMTRVVNRDRRLVYVILVNKKLKYPKGRSRIAYIGTTKNGVARFAQSAAFRAGELLTSHGVNMLEVKIITCRGRKRVTKIWHKLERASLIAFREKYGRVPRCNRKGKGIKERGEFLLFSKKGILSVLHNLARRAGHH